MMSGTKRVIVLSEFEHNVLINGFNTYRNMLLESGEPLEDIDKLLTKLLYAPTKREQRRCERDER